MMEKDQTFYSIQKYDNIIKFRTLNRYHNYIFIKNKNSIQVYEPIKLVQIYCLYHNEEIKNFEINTKNNSIILFTHKNIEIYNLEVANLTDIELKLKYILFKSIQSENIANLSVSSLGDIICTINKHRVLKFFDMNLNLIKTANLNLNIVNKEQNLFPLEYFHITYDTRNICLCKYNFDKISMIYKSQENLSDNINDENNSEYKENIFPLNEPIIFIKEFQKSFSMYIDYQDSSIYFVLTKELNFLILRKVYEKDPATYDNIPTLITFLYINLNTQTETSDYNYLSFSLIYDNQNPIFKSDLNFLNEYKSGIINMDNWEQVNKNTLSDNENTSFLNYNEYYLKNISINYILFNFKENLIMYKITGLHSPPFNNPVVEKTKLIKKDIFYKNTFTLIKCTKTLDRKYSIFFIDKYQNIRKFNINNELNNEELIKKGGKSIYINDSKQALILYRKIIYCEFNNKNRKTLVLQRFNKDSLIDIINSKLDLFKLIIFENTEINNCHWIKNSNFIIFSYNFEQKIKIGIIYIYSKYLDNQFNIIDNEILQSKFISIDIDKTFGKITENIISIDLDIPFLGNEIIDREAIDNNNNLIFNEIQTDLLIKADNFLYYNNLIIKQNKSKSDKYITEYMAVLLKKFNFDKNIIKDQENWETKDFMFNNENIYYFYHDIKYNIVNILKIEKNGNIKKIFEMVIYKELLFNKIFLNNYFIFITNKYINSFDAINHTYYRMKNDFLTVDNKDKINIDVVQNGVYLNLVITTPKNIRLSRIPRNKNTNEKFTYEFKYTFDILKNVSKISFLNNMIILNESQIVSLTSISKINHKLLYNSTAKELLLLNANAYSIFDSETIMDLFLSDNEDCIKQILDIFCNFYSKYNKNFIDQYKNSKLIPNLTSNIIKNLLFDTKIEFKTEEEKTGIKTNLIKDLQLKFKSEEDDPKTNPIKLWCTEETNMYFLNKIYNIISDEKTRGVDNFTKYIMLKFYTKRDDLEKGIFKLSSADLCWISLITNQTNILNFLSKGKQMTWNILTLFNIPMWIKSDVKLKELLEQAAKSEYTRQELEQLKSNQDKTQQRNFTENIALYLYLADKQNLIIEYFGKEVHNEKIKKFIMRDFSVKKNRKIAKENADALMNKKKYFFAAYFYLLADDIRSAIDMTLEKLKDINLTVCVLRLITSKYGDESWKKYYSLDKIYQDYFINFGIIFRDPYLVLFGYLNQNKIDKALEFILNYNNEYSFEENNEIIKNIDDYKDNLELILTVLGMNVFDYKMIFFAKILEKLYHTKMNEAKNNVKNLENTNFNDNDWDMDNFGKNEEEEEEEDDVIKNESQFEAINDDSNSLKTIDINYNNLTSICLTNALKRGCLFVPLLNIYKENHNNSFNDLPIYLKELLMSLLSNRIVLDTLYLPDKNMIDEYYNNIDLFFNFFEENNMLYKRDLYKQMTFEYLVIDKYQHSFIPCIKSNTILDTFIAVNNYTERLINKNIYLLINFNFPENINLKKVNTILDKITNLINFIEKFSEYNLNFKQNKKNNPPLSPETRNNLQKTINDEIKKTELNLYIFRIIFMILFYLLFVAKITLKYEDVTKLYQNIYGIIIDYNNFQSFDEKRILNLLTELKKYHNKLQKHIDEIINKKKNLDIDESLYFFIQLVNLSILILIDNCIKTNPNIQSITLEELNKKNQNFNKVKIFDHYFHENFYFPKFIDKLAVSFINNFENNLIKYINDSMKISLIYKIHQNLKSIYFENSKKNSDFNYQLFKSIKINKLFESDESFTLFEYNFKISEVVKKYINFLCARFKYERKNPDGSNNEIFEIDPSNPTNNNPDKIESYYTNASISIVKKIFGDGIEIANFNNDFTVYDFCIDNTDISRMAIALKTNGHRKINILNSLYIKSRSNDFYKLEPSEMEKDKWEESYINSFHNYNYINIAEKYYDSNKYNEILSVINHTLIFPQKNIDQFPTLCSLPFETYNEGRSDNYYKDVSLMENIFSSYTKLTETHPQLPLYLTANEKGVVSVWNYSEKAKKNINEYYIDNINKDRESKHELIKIHFSSYGNEFLAVGKNGNLYNWSFENIKEKRVPKTIINSNLDENIFIKDAVYLNNSGIIVSSSNKKDTIHKSIIWDLLLPPKENNVGSVKIGGNIIVPFSTNASFAVCNDTKGSISFIDIRKLNEGGDIYDSSQCLIKTFVAHNSEIKAARLSERENFLVTFGTDLYVKIWDVKDKSNPILIEEIMPFLNSKYTEKKAKLQLRIINGFLFASNDNQIKLLRNNIY